jgi:3-deoxy-D-arabino-heptulosonate 7-phosphate (DAHP) synthase
MVESISLTSIITGADELIIEVHPGPVKAYSNGPQSLKLAKFPTLCKILDPSPN